MIPQKNLKLILALILIFLFNGSASFAQTNYDTRKPWTYWWWMGSAVNKKDIKTQLDAFSRSGIGGVHIIPVYGAKGYENQFIPFLSEKWLEMVKFTIEEAGNLNLGVDVTLGTGWPYGGPWVDKSNAAKQLVISQNNTSTDPLLNHLQTANTNQKVKRAAPGGEGWVIDYFDERSVKHYLQHYDSIFSVTRYPVKPRSWYHDSYEVYQANWSLRFSERFRQLHGYDLGKALSVILDTMNPARQSAVHDFRETLSELLYSEFATTWTSWCKNMGIRSRYQAHGSPGNLLDLYALSDIPETESFGCSNFPIPQLHNDPDYEEERFGRPSPLLMKFASSPAHLLNKPLVSSETATWLANHFKVSLSQIKPQVDELFISGINHVFYHGTTYSPEKENYPGWLFYASTNFGLTSHFRDELPLLNSYILDCQDILQNSSPDNDILLYFPIDELWTTYPGDLLLLLDVHKYSNWFEKTEFGKTSKLLWDNGFAFDYLSDKQIGQLVVNPNRKVSVNARSSYSVIVIPSIECISLKTLIRLDSLAQKGAEIIFIDQLPEHLAGYKTHNLADATLSDLKKKLSRNTMISDNVLRDLVIKNIRKEEIKLEGLDFIRKRTDKGYVYFITNLGNRFYEDSISLAVQSNYIELFDPQSLKKGYIKTSGRFLLQLPPGKSCFIQVLQERPKSGPWQYSKSRDTILLNKSWTISFISGNNQDLKPAYKTDTLQSWTEWGDEKLKSFCGKAKYVSTFTLKNNFRSSSYRLVFDDVRETAAITINGTSCGTIWSIPYSMEIPASVLKKHNTIEITVQNLSANLIRKMDAEGVPWKKFYDINFVDIRYQPFNASGWDIVPSGLIGKIVLVEDE